MRTTRWKPLPDDVMGATRELAEQLRHLVDRAGLNLRQLAADDHIPYGVPTLRQFFSGEVLPPHQLVGAIADRCGGDRALLLSTLDRAIAARNAGLPWAAIEIAPRPRRTLRDRPGLIIAACAAFVVVAIVLSVVVALGLTGKSSPDGAQAQPAPSTGPTIRSHTPSPSKVSTPPPTPAPTKRPSRGYDAVEQKSSGNLIRNGTFTGTTTSWWPVSEVRLSGDADRLRADVRGGSTEPWHRIVSAASFPLQYGRTYTLSFDASASTGITDQVTVQHDYEPYTQVISRKIALTTSPRHFSYRFTANLNTDEAALNFELGAHPTDHTIWLDNVTLTPR
jgi:Carbohydrate binding domain